MSEDDPLARLFALQHLGIKFGLDNIRALCAALGRPDERFSSIIIAGTNGKGSVTALVEHALRAASHRTGRYTSPHLISLGERFAIDGRPVDAATMTRAAARVLATADALRQAGTLVVQPTFFEVTTAMALQLFADAGVDLAVLEVGLGGRFDATNVVTPIAAAITTIDLDHQQFLGSTIASIAFEKAGVIKPGIPVVVGERKREAVDVIRAVCDERGANFIDAHAGTRVERSAGGSVRIQTPAGVYGPVTLALAGEHQIENAMVAVRLVESLAAAGTRAGLTSGATGMNVPRHAIEEALSHVSWRGRLEWLDFPGGRRLLVDSAHNPAGAASLAAYLAREHGRPLPIVLALMRDKDARGIIAALRPHAAAFIVTRPQTERASDPAELAALVATGAPEIPVAQAATPADALERAFAIDQTACACGSIFLVGEVLAVHAKTQSE